MMKKEAYEKAVMNVRKFKGEVSNVILTSEDAGGGVGAGGRTSQDDSTFGGGAKGFIGEDFWD